jgi:hypothetical protein
MGPLFRLCRAAREGGHETDVLLRALLSIEAENAREAAARARMTKDTRPPPAGWDELENVR